MVVNPVVLCSEVGVGDRGRGLWGNQLDAPLTPVSVPQEQSSRNFLKRYTITRKEYLRNRRSSRKRVQATRGGDDERAVLL